MILETKDFEALRRQMGGDAWLKTTTISCESKRFFDNTLDIIRHDRMGEVVFAVQRPNGRFIAVRSAEYPAGIFRIPTGGIGHGEDIVKAVRREVTEELGLEASIEKFIGVYRIEMLYKDEKVLFHSCFFHLKEQGGRLLEDATDDEVAEVKEVDSKQLYALAENLKHIEHSWRDWGRFRYVTTNTIADYIRDLENKP